MGVALLMEPWLGRECGHAQQLAPRGPRSREALECGPLGAQDGCALLGFQHVDTLLVGIPIVDTQREGTQCEDAQHEGAPHEGTQREVAQREEAQRVCTQCEGTRPDGETLLGAGTLERRHEPSGGEG